MTNLRIAPAGTITQISQALMGVSWPASVDIIDPLVAQLGWQRIPNDKWIDVQTNLDVGNQSTSFLSEDGLVLEIDVFVSDFVEKDGDSQAAKNGFKCVLGFLVGVLGKPSGRRGTDVWWETETGCRLHFKSGVVIKLQWLSKQYADIERGEARHQISPDRVLGQDE